VSKEETAPPNDPELMRLAEKLRGLHEQAGVDLPDEAAMAAPTIYVGAEGSRPTPQTFVRDLVSKVRTRGLYVRNEEVGTVNELTGEFDPMSPHDLVTWVPHVAGVIPIKGVTTDKETGKTRAIEGDIGVEMARIFLASKELKSKLPVIEHVNLVPMPVYRTQLDERDEEGRKGFRKIELLQPGYDAETRTFTVHGGPCLDESIDGMDAAQWLFDIAKTFDWSEKDSLGRSNRMSVHFSAMLSVFCRYLFPGKAPFFAYVSNLEGSGKGALVKWCLLPVFRRAGNSTLDPNDRTELLKVLDTKAASGAEYVWADEMPDGLQIRDLHLARWATSNIWEMRPMGQNKKIGKYDITKMLTFITANRVTFDRNIGRRTFIADLFPHQEVNERVLPKGTIMLDDEFFEDEKNLDKTLSCLWALVKMWDEMKRRKPTDRVRESFSGWSNVVPAIVECAGLGRALVPFEVVGGGDDQSVEMKKLARLIIDEHCMELRGGVMVPLRTKVVMMKDIVRSARLNNLFVDKLWSIDAVLEELAGQRNHKWKPVPQYQDNGEPITDTAGEPLMGEPDDKAKRLQAAEWLGQAIGAKWGHFFKKMAVIGHWFTSSTGIVYQFGKRESSKGSMFELERVGGKDDDVLA
jgi:hypothetical protein